MIVGLRFKDIASRVIFKDISVLCHYVYVQQMNGSCPNRISFVSKLPSGCILKYLKHN